MSVCVADLDNFYASCHRVFDPKLRKRPVVVLSNNDGCVIARSNEAKILGIPMGAPEFKYRHIFKRYNFAILSSNFDLYMDMSERNNNILAQYSPIQEMYSIDESFIDFSGMQSNIDKYATGMRNHVGKWLGLPISFGIAPTKTLAKVAVKVAKKFPDITGGIYNIDTETKREKALRWLKVEDIWGIGRKRALKLNSLGIYNAWDFTEMPEQTVLHLLTVVGYRIHRELRGIPEIPFETIEKKKSITTTRSFEREYSTPDELTERIITFTALAAERMRKQESMCKVISLFIETNPFKEDAPIKRSMDVKLPFHTLSTIELAHAATDALNKIYVPNRHYKRAGVELTNFIDKDQYEKRLFDCQNPQSSHFALMQVIDKINTKYNGQKLRLASQDEQTEKMRREHISPCYTTNFKDAMRVKI
ncbi:MAG: Y-family DNA polymerase [Bacteroidia bacterium]|nr:Y-family DNA polymerase [Bacteroidia bacterium]